MVEWYNAIFSIAGAAARAPEVPSGKKRMRSGRVSRPWKRTKQRDKTDGKPFAKQLQMSG
jgi:hypothetical protein